MHLSRTKLIKIDDKIAGYFTMEFRKLKISIDDDDNIYPVLCLKCLAIDKSFQGNGIGTIILEYITPQCKDLSDFIGCRCLIIDAISEKILWYKERGFQFIDNEKDIDKLAITVPMFIDFRDNEILFDYFDEGV